MPDPDTTTPERCRFSIRLPRPLWIGVAAGVIVVAAIGLRFGLPIYRQQVAIREIKRLGASIGGRSRGPEWFRRFVGEERTMIFDEVFWVTFHPDEATYARRSATMILFGGLPPKILGPTINDARLACIAGMPNLTHLDLRWTNVSDAGMEHVCRLRYLEELYLTGTDVSDASVDRLIQLRQLKKLILDRRRVSKAGLAQIAAALPPCDIISVGPLWTVPE